MKVVDDEDSDDDADDDQGDSSQDDEDIASLVKSDLPDDEDDQLMDYQPAKASKQHDYLRMGWGA